MPVGETMPEGYSLFYTNHGNVRKTEWKEFDVAKNSYKVINLKDGEKVIGIENEIEDQHLVFVTKQGLVVHLAKADCNPTTRNSGATKHITLNDGDEAIFIGQVETSGDLLFVSDKGYAKRVPIGKEFKINNRYNKGVTGFPLNEKSGEKLVFAGYVHANYNIVIKVSDDYLSQFGTNNIPRLERTSQGKPMVRGKVNIPVVYIYNDDINNGY